MWNRKLIICFAIHSIFCLRISCQNDLQPGSIYINRAQLTSDDMTALKKIYGVKPIAGSYWYDVRSGAFGEMGGPVLGVMYPGHNFAAMPSDASNGTSGVFINSRQLQKQEAFQAARLFGYYAPVPGRYWLDANGNMGIEGYLVPLGNIYAAMAQAQQRSGTARGNDNFWTSGLFSGGNYYTGANGQPSQGYVSVPGYGPVSFGM